MDYCCQKLLNEKSDIHGDFKNIFDMFLDLYRGREVSVNQMVDWNYKADAKIVIEFL